MVKLSKHLKPFLLSIFICLATVVGQSVLSLLIPAQNVGLSQAIGANDWGGVLNVTLKLSMFALSAVVLNVLTMYFSAKVASGFGHKLRKVTYEKVMSLSVSEVEQFGTPSLITRTTADIAQMQSFTVMAIRIAFAAPVLLIGGVFAALKIQSEFSVVYMIALPLIGLTMAIAAIKGSKLFTQVQKKLDELTLVSRENLSGVRVIRAFNRQHEQTEKFEKTNACLTDISIRVNRLLAKLFPINSLIMNMTSIAIVVVGFFLFNGMEATDSQTLYSTIGATSAVVGYAGQILGSMIGLAFIFMMLPRAAASANRILEVLQTESSIVDSDSAVDFPSDKKGEVVFENVFFSYPDAPNPILKNISFSTKKGETTAIIGSTGSGKSTVAHLIPRFYDTTEGTIFVDGVDIKTVRQKDLRNKIGFVAQTATLFSGSVASNIRSGNNNITLDEVKSAAQVAQAAEFVENTHDAYDHIISQSGKNLSGGQKQRLSIARAIAKNPEILIFDDSFSALDFKTDKLLREHLGKYIKEKGCSMIIVAQRVSTVLDADQIIVLDNGSIVGVGKHKDLMKNCQPYIEIVLSQMNEEEAK